MTSLFLIMVPLLTLVGFPFNRPAVNYIISCLYRLIDKEDSLEPVTLSEYFVNVI